MPDHGVHRVNQIQPRINQRAIQIKHQQLDFMRIELAVELDHRNGVQRETSEYLISWRPALALGKSAMRCSVCAAEFSVITGPQRLDQSANSDAFRDSEVVVVLKVEPKLCRQAEIFSQSYRGFGG